MITNLKNLHSLFLSVWYFHILLIWMLTSITIFSISLFPCLRNICNKNVYYLWTTTDCAIRLLLYIHNCSSVHLMHHNPSLELDKLIPLSFLIIVPLDPQYMPFFTILSSYKVVKSFWMNRQLPPKAFFSYVYSIKYSFINVLRWMILSFRNAKPHHQRSELSTNHWAISMLGEIAARRVKYGFDPTFQSPVAITLPLSSRCISLDLFRTRKIWFSQDFLIFKRKLNSIINTR